MRILLANKFYYARGGDCRVAMLTERLLAGQGHDVAFFAQQYPLNEASPWAAYWPPTYRVGAGPGLVGRLSGLADTVVRPLGWGGVARRFDRLLADFGPEVVHLHNVHTQLSPILAERAHRRGIRVVWTLHDTKLVCPSYCCMRGGRWCDDCIGRPWSVVRHRCVKGSLGGSLLAWLEARRWSARRLAACTDLFVAPSRFMRDLMVRGGFPAERLRVVSNCVSPLFAAAGAEVAAGRPASVAGAEAGSGRAADAGSAARRAEQTAGPGALSADGGYLIYVGRLSREKGVATLCAAVRRLGRRLVVVGDGPMADPLRCDYADVAHIRFTGALSQAEVLPLLAGARCSVIPAEWSENNPLAVLESLAVGTPVVGAHIGGIPELIVPPGGGRLGGGAQSIGQDAPTICSPDYPIGQSASSDGWHVNSIGQDASLIGSSAPDLASLPVANGMTFRSGDCDDLARAIEAVWDMPFDRPAIAAQALARYAPEAFCRQMLACYAH